MGTGHRREGEGGERRGLLTAVLGCCCSQADVLSCSVSHIRGEGLRRSSSALQWLREHSRSTVVLEMQEM